jgi:hypothetical protein
MTRRRGEKDDNEGESLHFVVPELLSLRAGGKKSKSRQQLTWGEFEPADGTRTAAFLRYAFLEQIRAVERAERTSWDQPRRIDVLTELSGIPLQRFEQADVTHEQLRQLVIDPFGTPASVPKALLKAVELWAQGWHLHASWCLSVAFETLALWRNIPDTVKKRAWGQSFPLGPSDVSLPDRILRSAPFDGLPPFFAHIEMRSSYERRMRGRISRLLRANPLISRLNTKLQQEILNADMQIVEEYCDWVMRVYKLQKDETGSHIWQPVSWSPDLARDLRWAVEVQVRGRAASDIAREELRERQLRGEDVEDIPASKITRRVDKILREIDLPKRSDYRVGRPGAATRKHSRQ